ncbi:hypothetical protein D3C80_934150 [compost metagenome]
MLGRTVDAAAWHRQQAGDRGGVDDVAVILLRQHARDKTADAMGHAHDVDADHPLPILLGGGPQRATDQYPGVVEQQVRGAEARIGRKRQLLDLLRLGDITFHRQHARARRQQLHRTLQVLLVDVGQRQAHALIGAGNRQFATEAAGGAGNDGDFVVQWAHQAKSLWPSRIFFARLMRCTSLGPS